MKLVKGFYDPLPSVTMQKYKFNTRIWGARESVSNNVAGLRKVALHSKYKDSLQGLLRDRLVCRE